MYLCNQWSTCLFIVVQIYSGRSSRHPFGILSCLDPRRYRTTSLNSASSHESSYWSSANNVFKGRWSTTWEVKPTPVCQETSKDWNIWVPENAFARAFSTSFRAPGHQGLPTFVLGQPWKEYSSINLDPEVNSSYSYSQGSDGGMLCLLARRFGASRTKNDANFGVYSPWNTPKQTELQPRKQISSNPLCLKCPKVAFSKWFEWPTMIMQPWLKHIQQATTNDFFSAILIATLATSANIEPC